MEYIKDKRTKNLSLCDIHVGDWVQEWSPAAERYSPPLKVSSIHWDGTIYLVPDDEHHCDPVETEIENVDALPIDGDLLRGFGFDKDGDFYSFNACGYLIMATDNQLDVMDFSYIDRHEESAELGGIAYMHELQQALYEERNFIGFFNPEWKGVER